MWRSLWTASLSPSPSDPESPAAAAAEQELASGMMGHENADDSAHGSHPRNDGRDADSDSDSAAADDLRLADAAVDEDDASGPRSGGTVIGSGDDANSGDDSNRGDDSSSGDDSGAAEATAVPVPEGAETGADLEARSWRRRSTGPASRQNHFELMFYAKMEASGGGRSMLQFFLFPEGVFFAQTFLLGILILVNIMILIVANNEIANWLFVRCCAPSALQYDFFPSELANLTVSRPSPPNTNRSSSQCSS